HRRNSDRRSTLYSTPLNVPIPVASGAGGTPTEVTFTTVFDHAETLTWTCMAPCGSGPMSTPGFMTGTITVS
ncbi:MAG: hypothetical protein KGI89_13995, partial [Euryarchaeota archaeon]|nr:hypothetical protein [Euryarchaeota archaeon]